MRMVRGRADEGQTPDAEALAHGESHGGRAQRVGDDRLPPVPASVCTKSPRRSAKVGWVRCIGLTTRSSIAMSRSKSYLTLSRTTPNGSHGSHAKPRSWPRRLRKG